MFHKPLNKAILIFFSLLFLASIGSAQKKNVQVTPLISSFNAGELSPRLDFRSDLEKYYSGCRTLENMIPLVEGGATRMPGTYFVLETKDSSKESSLIPFQFSTIQSYVIEAGDYYFRFYKDDGQINTVDSNTTLLLHADGTDGGTTFTDSGYNSLTVTANGNAQIDTAQFEFGTGAALFDATSDYLSVSDSDGADDWWNLGANAFTIDFWYRPNGLPANGQNDVLFIQNDDATHRWTGYVYNYGLGYALYFYVINGASSYQFWINANITTNTWNHIAFIRGWGGVTNTDAGWEIVVNGSTATKTILPGGDPTMAIPNLAANLEIGGWAGGANSTDGWIDEFRVSKGVARWTTDLYSPPTQAYPFIDSGALTGGGGTVYEVTTPYAAADVKGMKTMQSADVLYLFHPSYPPKTLSRTGHTSWTLSDLQAKTGNTMTITGISQANPATVTCATVPTTLAAGDIVYISDVTGMTQVNNLFFTTGTVITGAGGSFQLASTDSTAYTAWASGGTAQECIYGTTDKNPSCGTFFEQRLALAGANDYPQRIDLSASSDYENYSDGTGNDAAIQYTIVSDRVDRIYWMLGFDYMMIGTAGGIWKMGATDSGEPLSPTNVTTKKQVTMAAKNISPEMVTDSLLWITKAGTSVRQLSYSFEADKYVAPDMTRIAKHIAFGSTRALSGITQIAFQREPLPILWAIRADGQLLGMTYEIQEQVFAWFRIVTDGSFESVAVISEEDAEDKVWVIVNRTIENTTKRYVEYFKPIEIFGDITDAFFVHSGLTWDGGDAVNITNITKAACATVTAPGHTFIDGDKVRIQSVGGMTQVNIGTDTAWTVKSPDWSAGTFVLYTETAASCVNSSGYTAYTSGGTVTKVTESITGLTHLEDETVAILVDGAVHLTETVASGAISLDWYGNKIHVGMPYTSILEPMKLNAGAEQGSTARGKKQRIYRVTVGFYQTGAGVQYGPSQDDLRTFEDLAEDELTTDDIEVSFHSGWGDDSRISIVMEDPLPMTILGIIPWVSINE